MRLCECDRQSDSHFFCAGREPDAPDSMREKGQKAQTDLSSLVNNFILRRTNELLSKHLPPKVVQIVCCHMTQLQVRHGSSQKKDKLKASFLMSRQAFHAEANR